MTFRGKGTPNTERPMSLPTFSVDTEEEAQSLLVLHGVRTYDGRYCFTGFGGDLADLHAAADTMAASYARMRQSA